MTPEEIKAASNLALIVRARYSGTAIPSETVQIVYTLACYVAYLEVNQCKPSLWVQLKKVWVRMKNTFLH